MNKENGYIVGQRWFNYADSQLGLGIITAIEWRCLKVSFPAVEDERTYALDKAPLCRIIYRVGDEIKTSDDIVLTVTSVTDEAGLLLYTGFDGNRQEHLVPELAINPVINFSAPLERLFAGLVDRHRDYHLKIQTLNLSARLHQSQTRGLIGARTEHIPHQVYIASEVAKRFAPRVLLADEVGLGKTIEAGLILHHQLITGRAQRIIIIVPQTLVHQWLVEMLRRFNLTFSLFDQERYQAIEDENPFETEQLIITSLDFLMANSEAANQAQNAKWDLVIVDEAHHLHWSEENPSPEYCCIEQFALLCQGLLLLTATPEQLGIESHFARLRLLDSARFQDLAQFKADEQGFEHISLLAGELLQFSDEAKTDLLPETLKEKISVIFGSVSSSSISETLTMLLDQHGTGRVLFRNTRAAISGFPTRVLNFYPLDKPSVYYDLISEGEMPCLYPETLLLEETWLKEDPRVLWLIDTIRRLRPNKVLVITANMSTAIALEKYLRVNTNIRASAFHEGLTIIERDRAGAYFADLESGAECLICSEIGSEGRNFQFSHELILFDLPLNPDLLEQRIGRLDRIGQQNDINIHVPFIHNTPMAVLFYWYHEGLNLFEKSCSFGFSIYEQFEEELLSLLNSVSIDESQLKLLIEKTKIYTKMMQKKSEVGRDRLLEFSSCNLDKSAQLISAIEQEEDPLELKEYMNKVFNAFGVSHEFHSEHTEILRPSEHMKIGYFPGLKEDGNTVTYSREKALVREDIDFLSVEHPMVREVMEMILNEEGGSAVLSTMSLKGLPAGTLLLEAFYTVRAIAPEALDLNRYLSLTPLRVLTSLDGKNLDGVLSHEQLIKLCSKVKRQHAYPIINKIRSQIEIMSEYAKKHTETVLPTLITEALTKLNHELGYELARITALKKVNPTIRNEEIEFIENQLIVTEKAINNAYLKLEGLRVVINK